jgi:hypothetical protein
MNKLKGRDELIVKLCSEKVGRSVISQQFGISVTRIYQIYKKSKEGKL